MKITEKYQHGMDIREVAELVRRGVTLTCPRCGAELNVALSFEEARTKKMAGGIFCPTSQSHVAVLLEFVESRRAMRELFAELRAKREERLKQSPRHKE